MKTLIKLAFITGCIFLASCAKKQTAQELLKDENMRSDIMKTICNDSDMTIQMINYISTTKASQQMLPVSCLMLDRIMGSNAMKKDTAMQNLVISGMLGLMSTDSLLCDKTCTQMSKTPSIQQVLQKKR